MKVAYRVLVGAFLCIAPSLLFLGFWHGLQRMQEGELVARVADRQGAAVEDLVPGANPYRSGEPDLADRRALERFAAEDAPNEAGTNAFAPDERDSS